MKTWRLHLLALLHIAAAATLVACLSSSAAAQPYEKEISFQASRFVPNESLATAYYTIEQAVSNQGYLNQYTIRSPHGDQVVSGKHLLLLRLGELRALDEISKVSRSSVFLDAAGKNGKAALMAPVTLGKKVVSVVQQPSQIVDTAKKIPDGISRIFSWGVDTVGSGASYIGKQFSSDKDSKQKSEGSAEGEPSDSSKAAKIAKDQGLRYIKYSSTERDWFQRLGVDQYTDNLKLQDEVERVSQVETAVNLGFKFVPGFNLGLVGSVVGWYERAEKLGLYEPYDILNKKNNERMKSLGVDDKIAKRFSKNAAFRPSFQTVLLDCLQSLTDVTNLQRFVALAATAENPEQAIYYMDACKMLTSYDGKQGPLTTIVTSAHLPGAVTASEHLILPLAVEYLLWTKDTTAILRDYKKALLKQAKVNAATVLILGQASAATKTGLEKLGGKVIELNKY